MSHCCFRSNLYRQDLTQQWNTKDGLLISVSITSYYLWKKLVIFECQWNYAFLEKSLNNICTCIYIYFLLSFSIQLSICVPTVVVRIRLNTMLDCLWNFNLRFLSIYLENYFTILIGALNSKFFFLTSCSNWS